MQFIKDDGGRSQARYKGITGDCVVRAIAIVTGKPYQVVYDEINSLCKITRYKKSTVQSSSRTGVMRKVYDQYLLNLGYKWIPTMKIGSGCTVHLCDNELPMGRLIVRVSKHMVAVIDGVIHDNYNPSRFGTRCVYGYFIKD